MTRLLLIGIPFAILIFAASASTAYAQETPKAEVFAGYSYMHDDLPRGDLNMNGVEISGVGNINDWLGIEGDFSVHHNEHTHSALMGGPRFAYRHGRVVPWVHALAGVDGDYSGDGSGAFTMAVGGGVDVKINDHFTYRVAQVDYHPIFYGETTAHNVRVSTGIVFTFGSK